MMKPLIDRDFRLAFFAAMPTNGSTRREVTDDIQEYEGMRALHVEKHRTERMGWLRAAVLGANDGIVSTASLVVGVAAANAASSDILRPCKTINYRISG